MDLKFEHLLGKAYCPQKQNCYTLVREFYADNFQIDLKDYPFPIDWDSNQLDIVPRIADAVGAFKVEEWSMKALRPGDVLCLAINSNNPNHLAVYVGNNTLIHHLWLQLSKAEVLRDFWRMSTCYLLRHPDVPDFTPTLPETSIIELARARYNPSPDPEAE